MKSDQKKFRILKYIIRFILWIPFMGLYALWLTECREFMLPRGKNVRDMRTWILRLHFFFSQLGDLASYLVVCYYIHCIRLSPHQRDNRMIFFIGVCYHLNIFFISLLNITGLYNLAGSIRSPSSFDFFSDFPACFSSFPTSGVLRCFLYLYFYFFFSQFFFLSLRSFQSRQSCLR